MTTHDLEFTHTRVKDGVMGDHGQPARTRLAHLRFQERAGLQVPGAVLVPGLLCGHAMHRTRAAPSAMAVSAGATPPREVEGPRWIEPGAAQLICAARIELGAIDNRVRLRFLS
jgi:hypothetical protein